MAINPLALNDTLPAAPAGSVNNKWQADAPNPDPSVKRNTSTYTPPATATTPGAVPQPPNDVTKVLRGDMTYGAAPSGTLAGSLTDVVIVTPANNEVLTYEASSSKWKNKPSGAGGSGDLVKLDEVILGADGPSLAFSSISAAYRNLKIILTGRSGDATPDVSIQFNGDTGANYSSFGDYGGSSNGNITLFNNASSYIANIAPSTAPANQAGSTEIDIFDYARTQWNKNCRSIAMRLDASTTGYRQSWGLVWLNTAAITDILLIKGTGVGNFKAGTVATLYGLK